MKTETSPYSKLRVPFGEKDGRLYRPDAVERGKQCGCHCPECDAKLSVKRSVSGRLFFAHLRAENCLGGYETALHKMGKQILLDAGRVWLPKRDVTFSFPLIFGETLSETVSFEPREVQFESAVSEKKLDSGFIPDVTAVLKNGAPLYIEILVTHAVGEEKGGAIDNVMEIDLSRLSEETVLDSSELELEVLQRASRWWHRCSLFDELPEVQAAKAALKARVPKEIKHLERKKAAEMQKEEQARLKVERQEAQEKQRELERAPWLGALKRLEYANDFTGWLNMSATMSKRAEPHLASVALRLGFNPRQWPSFLNLPIDQEWVFKEDRRLWQSAVFEQLILANTPGEMLSVPKALAIAEKAAGVRPWALQLSQLKQAHSKRPENQKKAYELRGVWFLDPAENQAIRSPYAVVLSYLKALRKRGLLAEVAQGRSFKVLLSGSDIWETHRRQQQSSGTEWSKGSAGTFVRLAQNVSQESLQREAEKKQRRKELDEQIELSVIDAQSIAAAGEDSAIFCKSCRRHHVPDPTPDCPVCRSYQIKMVTLTESYLESLAARLRCMP